PFPFLLLFFAFSRTIRIGRPFTRYESRRANSSEPASAAAARERDPGARRPHHSQRRSVYGHPAGAGGARPGERTARPRPAGGPVRLVPSQGAKPFADTGHYGRRPAGRPGDPQTDDPGIARHARPEPPGTGALAGADPVAPPAPLRATHGTVRSA